jgi:hypothetical protein
MVMLFPVMGFTWIFGILFFGFRTRVLEYLFAIFCSLQVKLIQYTYSVGILIVLSNQQWGGGGA